MNVAEYLAAHERNTNSYKDFVDEVIFTIKEECEAKGLKIADIKGRVKTRQSLADKIERHRIENPEQHVFDYAGVRIVCLFEEEKRVFSNLLNELFDVSWQSDKKESLGVAHMGYQSIHTCVAFGDSYSGTRYRKFKGYVCEVQVTTVLLEAWALINHTIVYKNENSVPISLQRELNNVSSLLEVAQNIFDEAFKKRTAYLVKLGTLSNNSLLIQLIDYDSLTVYSENKYPELKISEFWQNSLIVDLNKNKYKNLSDIDNVVNKAKEFIEYYMDKRPDLFQFSTDILTKSLGYIDFEFRSRHDFAESTLRAFEHFENHRIGKRI
ncbi:hypothetical protein MUK70_06475 [Dyadobacter chenwenxiniae]|uniref:RelA/SpoT domain-containing protein n=1 Tax=Dyadobacter chenwenxiniae TaxID=2906456 RepID=A0A9X1TG51_9BACT|nr:hypothetical protein [Dyadobacter chenwenxiniae]MCF0065096.1 hypothetical protein [Dyadobacter chenwenxiniae]UON84632.1 hypothetical protein MUK70_06475 [Dyadobacter chenwenxiniae]